MRLAAHRVSTVHPQICHADPGRDHDGTAFVPAGVLLSGLPLHLAAPAGGGTRAGHPGLADALKGLSPGARPAPAGAEVVATSSRWPASPAPGTLCVRTTGGKAPWRRSQGSS